MEYNSVLRDLREDNDMTQGDVAKILDLDQSYYAKYENGRHPLPIKHLKTLCLLYKVSADYILGLPKGLNWPRQKKTLHQGESFILLAHFLWNFRQKNQIVNEMAQIITV